MTPLIGLVILIVIFSINEIRTKIVLSKIHKEYSTFSLDTKLNSRILNIVYALNPKMFRNDPNSSYITFVDLSKKRIKTSNELLSQGYFDDLVKIGDSIIKLPGSNKITILRIQTSDTIKINFILKDDLGYPLR